jgi:hypothetical protein
MKILKELCLFGGVLAAALPAAAERKFNLAPKPERVKEIAAWLPAEPQSLGAPIANREAWGKLASLPEAAKTIRAAEKLINEPVPEVPDEWYLEFTKTGNRSHYEGPYFHRVSQLDTLLLAECLENKGRFLPAIEKRVEAICGERSWTMPAHDGGLSNFNGTQLHIDLGSSYRAWVLAYVYGWLGDKLPAGTREHLRKEVYRRVLDVYLAAVRSGYEKGNWWMRGDNNWNAVCHAGVVTTALALVPERELRAEFLASMESDNPVFVSGFTPDGYCSEGMGYWNYGFGREVMMGLAVRAVTGGKLDIFTGEKMRKIAAYAQGYELQPGCSPFFADGGGAPGLDIWALMRQVWPDLVPNRAAGVSLLSGGCETIALRAFGQEPPKPVSDAVETLPVRTWFPDAQVLLSRPDPAVASASKPFSIAIKGGHNAEQHNHNDVGSYFILLDGLEMMGDPGGEIYTRRTFSKNRYDSKVLNSYGHPVPVVCGELQPVGRQSAARVVATDFKPERDTLVLDISKAYPVKTLKALTRTMVYDRQARVITVTDKVSMSAPGTFSVPVVTYCDVKKGDKPGTYWLTGKKGQKVQVDIEATGGSWKLAEEEIENPGKPSPKRLAVTFDGPVADASVTMRVTAQ